MTVSSEGTQPLIRITTLQSGCMKTLVEALKDILVESNLEFIPVGQGEDQGCIKILAVNNQAGMLVYMRLQSTNFDEFFCPSHQVLGINMQAFYRVIKTINNSDILTLYRSSHEYEKNRMTVRIMNKDKKQVVAAD